MKTEKSTRGRILKTAARMFCDLGYEGTSMRMIAEECGLTKASIYYHFESKEAILKAIIEEALNESLNAFREIYRMQIDAIEKIRLIFRNRFQIAREHAELVRIIFDLVMGKFRQKFIEDFRKFKPFREHQMIIERIIEEGKKEGSLRQELNPMVLNHILIGSMNYFTISAIRFNRIELSEELIDQILDILIQGIKVKEE